MGQTRQVGGCQTDEDGLVLLGEGCTVVQPSYPLCRIRILFDSRIELLSMSSAGETPVDVFSTVFMIRCTMGNCS